MENDIYVYYGENLIEENLIEIISPNTPSFEKLKNFVITNQETLNLDLITCKCGKKDFDIQTFQKAIKEAIKFEIKMLRINKEKFDEAMKSLS